MIKDGSEQCLNVLFTWIPRGQRSASKGSRSGGLTFAKACRILIVVLNRGAWCAGGGTRVRSAAHEDGVRGSAGGRPAAPQVTRLMGHNSALHA